MTGRDSFGAEIVQVSEMHDKRVLHAQLRFADGVLFLNSPLAPSRGNGAIAWCFAGEGENATRGG